MIIRTPREIALFVRERRRSLRMTQAQLAERIGASRAWVRLLESGKPRFELGLTLRAPTALGTIVDIQLRDAVVEAWHHDNESSNER